MGLMYDQRRRQGFLAARWPNQLGKNTVPWPDSEVATWPGRDEFTGAGSMTSLVRSLLMITGLAMFFEFARGLLGKLFLYLWLVLSSLLGGGAPTDIRYDSPTASSVFEHARVESHGFMGLNEEISGLTKELPEREIEVR